MSFHENGYVVVKNAISAETLDLVKNTIEIERSKCYYYNNVDDIPKNKFFFTDKNPLLKNTFVNYAVSIFEALSVTLRPTIEKIVGKDLLVTYSCYRYYYNKAVMLKHRDRVSCEYSISLCISNDEQFGAWPIWFTNYNNQDTALYLNPGDMVVYKGTELYHWREEYQGEQQIQAFLHYVDKNGKYKDYEFDKRKQLGLGSSERFLVY